MTMFEVETQDWKKAAAAAAQSNEDIEKSFLDAAYAAIANKATPIMRSPYRVGFEIVFKNDDNTRLVGVFVFRVGQELYYAPVFFLNGSIKGTELFYRVQAKRFVPMTNEWVEYLISLSESREGSGIPISERSKARNQLNLYQIIQPPNSFGGGGKFASEMKEALEKAASEIPSLPEASILRRFLVEDGGRAALAKIARAAESSRAFAEALALGTKEENYLIDFPETEKAAAAPQELLRIHTGLLYNNQIKTASAQDLAKGYQFEDFRKEADVNAVIFTDSTKELMSPDSPGIYKILLASGEQHEMLCAYYQHMNLAESYPTACYETTGPGPRPESHRMCLVDLTTKASEDYNSQFRKPLGGFVKDIKPEDIGVKKPSSGKAYRLLNIKSMILSEPFYVTSVKDKDGLVQCEISNGYRLKDTKTITLNPDFDGCDEGERIFGHCCLCLEVASKKTDSDGPCCGREVEFDCDLSLGDRVALNRMIFDNGYKQACVKRREQAWLIDVDGDRHGEFHKLAAVAFLMTRCDMTEAAAEQVMTEAEKLDKFAFWFEPKLTKSAYNIRFNQWPDFYQSTNSDYNVLQEPDTKWMIRADSDRPVIERNRIGDKYSGGSQNQDSAMDTATPTQLYEMSKERGVGSLFEHGVVAALVNTYDSMAMLDKYLPDLEQALDRMGRILFLFYWKPEDFVQAFGSDDQSQLENKLISSFRSFGDLTLELLKKNRQNQQGSASMA